MSQKAKILFFSMNPRNLSLSFDLSKLLQSLDVDVAVDKSAYTTGYPIYNLEGRELMRVTGISMPDDFELLGWLLKNCPDRFWLVSDKIHGDPSQLILVGFNDSNDAMHLKLIINDGIDWTPHELDMIMPEKSTDCQ